MGSLNIEDIEIFIKQAANLALQQKKELNILRSENKTLKEQVNSLSNGKSKLAASKNTEINISNEQADKFLDKLANINLVSNADREINKFALMNDNKVIFGLANKLADKIISDNMLKQGSAINNISGNISNNLTSGASDYVNQQYADDMAFLSSYRD